MKNRKKRLMKIGAVIAVIAVAGIAGGVVICKGANRFELTVAGDPISKEEYVNLLKTQQLIQKSLWQLLMQLSTQHRKYLRMQTQHRKL